MVIQGQRSLTDGQPLTLLERLDYDSEMELTEQQEAEVEAPESKQAGSRGQQGQQRPRSRPGG